ncbi:MAG: hypothetical protein WKG07_37090 [Hymenobacter sp.]
MLAEPFHLEHLEAAGFDGLAQRGGTGIRLPLELQEVANGFAGFHGLKVSGQIR